MGLEKTLQKMRPKDRKLIENLFAVGFIFTIAYAFITLGWMGGDVMGFLKSGNFITVAVMLIFTYFGYSIIKKGKLTINIPQNQQKPRQPRKQPPKRTQTVSVRKTQKPHLSIPKVQETHSYGSIKCPQCGSLIIGKECKHCGYRR